MNSTLIVIVAFVCLVGALAFLAWLDARTLPCFASFELTIEDHVSHSAFMRKKYKLCDVRKGKSFYRGRWCDCYIFTILHDYTFWHSKSHFAVACDELLMVEMRRGINDVPIEESEIGSRFREVLGDMLTIKWIHKN